MMTRSRTLFLTLVSLFVLAGGSCRAGDLDTGRIRLPEGFKIEVYAGKVPGARSLALGDRGTVFVGTRQEGKVYAVVGTPPKVEVLTIASGLNSPNGVAFRDGSLYVAEISRVIRFDRIEERLRTPPKPVVVNGSFPDKEHHGWKFIRFGPDGKLYVPVGAPCNVCDSKDKRFASIMRMDPDGRHLEVFASGVRNTVGFDWHPATREMWFTDNGRDWLGDNAPPDELNRAPKAGLHFGFPYWHGKKIPDPALSYKMKHDATVPPEVELPAHVAALGMRFYTGTSFPPEYRGQIFIAEHGSWNRSVPNGYRISLVRLQEKKAPTYQVFAEGWLKGRSAWGRPVDLQIMPDGSILVSDDKGGALYRISRK